MCMDLVRGHLGTSVVQEGRGDKPGLKKPTQQWICFLRLVNFSLTHNTCMGTNFYLDQRHNTMISNPVAEVLQKCLKNANTQHQMGGIKCTLGVY